MQKKCTLVASQDQGQPDPMNWPTVGGGIPLIPLISLIFLKYMIDCQWFDIWISQAPFHFTIHILFLT